MMFICGLCTPSVDYVHHRQDVPAAETRNHPVVPECSFGKYRWVKICSHDELSPTQRSSHIPAGDTVTLNSDRLNCYNNLRNNQNRKLSRHTSQSSHTSWVCTDCPRYHHHHHHRYPNIWYSNKIIRGYVSRAALLCTAVNQLNNAE